VEEEEKRCRTAEKVILIKRDTGVFRYDREKV
jgi:hypothetical protein